MTWKLATVGLLVVVALAAAGIGIFVAVEEDKRSENLLKATFAWVRGVDSYVQEVETTTVISDRSISILGTYINDHAKGVYASFSTTTVHIPDTADPITFRLSNIFENGTVHVKTESLSENLIATVPTEPVWHTFAADSIPKEFSGIAIPGAVLDIFALFAEDGAYLDRTDALGTDASFTTPLERYRFRLSEGITFEGGAGAALAERLSGGGTIDVWIHEESAAIRHVVLANAPYFSTTSISFVNDAYPVDVPK